MVLILFSLSKIFVQKYIWIIRIWRYLAISVVQISFLERYRTVMFPISTVPPYGIFIVNSEWIECAPYVKKYKNMFVEETYRTSITLRWILSVSTGYGTILQTFKKYKCTYVWCNPPNLKLWLCTYIRMYKVCRTDKLLIPWSQNSQ